MTTDTIKKRYGLFTAIAMIIGIVIGSGIFFKSDNILRQADIDFIDNKNTKKRNYEL